MNGGVLYINFIYIYKIKFRNMSNKDKIKSALTSIEGLIKSNFPSFLYSLSIVIASFAVGKAILNRNKPEHQITVTGLGEVEFNSDLIVWDGKFSRENIDMKAASAALNQDKTIIENYLIKKGIKKSSFVFSSIDVVTLTNYRYGANGEVVGQEFAGYKLTQSIQISSSEIDKVEEISRNITELINEGIQLSSEPPRYYYTKLANLKLDLVSKATKDARERAEKIADEAGSDIDELISAQMGIIQITGLYSGEDFSWGGAYNTTSRGKTATITMKLNYKLD